MAKAVQDPADVSDGSTNFPVGRATPNRQDNWTASLSLRPLTMNWCAGGGNPQTKEIERCRARASRTSKRLEGDPGNFARYSPGMKIVDLAGFLVDQTA